MTKRGNGINMDRVRKLLRIAVTDQNGGCFVMKLKGEARVFVEEAMKAKTGGADIKYARVAGILRDTYNTQITAGSVSNHMRGSCKCVKTEKMLT